MTMLAIDGGRPVRDKPWPAWPRAAAGALERVAAVLASGRWTVRGGWTGQESQEQQLAARFAEWNGARFCVPCASGSSALVLALEALDVGAGDEVIVPVLGWIATSTAVLRVGAVPVFADIDRRTSCLSAAAAERALTPRTRAVIAVHLHASMADLAALGELSARAGVHLVEDCAQALGARWQGRAAGTFGAVGCFSFNQEKVLACGEGGAVLTGDARLWERLAALRADGHRFWPERHVPGEEQFDGAAGVHGANRAMSELNAAVGLAQLATLEDECRRRDEGTRFLDEALSALGWLTPLAAPRAVTRRGVYEYAVRVGRWSHLQVGAAVGAELGFGVHPTDEPLHRYDVFNPASMRRYANQRPVFAPDGYPEAEALAGELLVLPHWALLGGEEDLRDIVRAFEKVGEAFSRR